MARTVGKEVEHQAGTFDAPTGDRTMSPRAITLKEVTAKTSLHKSVIYKKLSEGKFPVPIQLAARRTVWLESEIDAWILDHFARRPAPMQKGA